MNDQHWQVAKAIAQTLQQQNTDVNELKKLVSYLQWWRNRQSQEGRNQLSEHLIQYLHHLGTNGETRSEQTQRYYQTLEKVCRENLELFETDAEMAIEILGWSTRLATYYKQNPESID
ncbi:MAG: hypothetical protein HC865_24095 [Cyanobacteria bacterium RU_5_0]|nr:hypothetical protein [Cyanobacteria bacterium RU_5_0]